MIIHAVLYKLKDNCGGERQKMIETFLSMKGKIPDLLDITAGADYLGSERSFDVALICKFADCEGLEKYREHPVHLPVKKYVHGITERSHSVDFEL
jgi:hypothetical protein